MPSPVIPSVREGPVSNAVLVVDKRASKLSLRRISRPTQKKRTHSEREEEEEEAAEPAQKRHMHHKSSEEDAYEEQLRQMDRALEERYSSSSRDALLQKLENVPQIVELEPEAQHANTDRDEILQQMGDSNAAHPMSSPSDNDAEVVGEAVRMKQNLRSIPRLYHLNEIVMRGTPRVLSSQMQEIYAERPQTLLTYPHPLDVLEDKNTRDLYERGGVYEEALDTGCVDCPVCKYGNLCIYELSGAASRDGGRSQRMKTFFNMYLQCRKTIRRPMLWDQLATFWNENFCTKFKGLRLGGAPSMNSGKMKYHFIECMWPNTFEEDRERVRKLNIEEKQLTYNGVFRVSCHYGELDTNIGNITVDIKNGEYRIKVFKEIDMYQKRMDATYFMELAAGEASVGEFVARAARKNMSRIEQNSLSLMEKLNPQLV